MTTFYKVLGEGGAPFHGGTGSWPLPTGNRPGKWVKVNGALIPCQHGLHLCRKQDLIRWLGPTIYVAEARGEIIAAEHKIVVREARLLRRLETWNDTTARLFAADCAADAVRRCRKAGLGIDPRVTDCIRVARLYARGEATAASAAAAAAARAAASAAAGSILASSSRKASAAAREWQTKRLFEYLDGKRAV